MAVAAFVILASCNPPQQYLDEHIRALARADYRVMNRASDLIYTYSDDGAADCTVVGISFPPTSAAHSAVVAIVDLGEAAIPLLIRHLDACASTNATLYRGKLGSVRVPVGHICLDILVHVSEPVQPMFYSADSPDDGLGASWGMEDGYYFRPDAYDLKEGVFIPRAIVKTAKANRLAAYESGQVRYRRPPWLAK